MLIDCSCSIKEREVKEQAKTEGYNKLSIEKILNKYKALSIVGEKTLNETFEHAEKYEETSEIFNIIENYCQNFDKAIEKNTGLYIRGKVGRGKTFLTNCMYNELRMKYSVLYISFNLYTAILQKGYENNKDRELEILEAIRTVDLLIIDDIGTKKMEEWATEKLFNLVDHRAISLKPLIVTSNCTFEELEERLQKYDKHGRIVSRIKGMCLDLELLGEDRRENLENFEWLLE